MAIASPRYNSIQFVKCLIDAGADLTFKNPRGRTVLHAAVDQLNSSCRIVELLLALGTDPTIPDHLGRSAFHAAVGHRRREAYDTIMAQSCSDMIKRGLHAKTLEGATAMHFAASQLMVTGSQAVSVVQDLLDKGFDINAISEIGQSPLHWAVDGATATLGTVSRETLESLQVFMRKGADVLIRDINGQTAGKLAAELKLDDLCAMLTFYSRPRVSVFGPFDFMPYWQEQMCLARATRFVR